MATLAIIGATGLVGREMLRCLEEADHLSSKLDRVRLFASSRSAGQEVQYRGESIPIEDLETSDFKGIDIGLFAVSSTLSKIFVPRLVELGGIAIDNSSAYRYDQEVPLIVPEVNGVDLEHHRGIIANPNCSTAQLVHVLGPIHRESGIERVIVSTYQSASGAGAAGEKALERELHDYVRTRVKGEREETSPFTRPLGLNLIPHIDQFLEDGYTREEMKIVWETRKILHAPNLEVSATAVRVPVFRGHSEAVTLDLTKETSRDTIVDLLKNSAGINVLGHDNYLNYPTPLDAEGNNFTWVGRIRQDISRPNTVHLWIVSDNLRKGAAYNAIQIADSVVEKM